jgi:hypothetical protein
MKLSLMLTISPLGLIGATYVEIGALVTHECMNPVPPVVTLINSFTSVTYSPNKKDLLTSIVFSSSAVFLKYYFATAVSYACNMFMK